MRLKRVRIFGFKTFADRTEVNLEGGVIAVVGPNGCGKSNLVDAILWGLGEGNARQLRAQSGQDVIFSGSSSRKAVGFTEVTLIFDNEDGGLPLDTPEVSITRKLTRGGDSDYSINKRSCRLRDLHDLLADSGLGRSGYSIVGQKEIDQALAASPEERRAWVDEAAGVQRYRARKVESQRRLSGAHQHLQRVTDILNELEGQREPLREEAEVATRYKSALGALRAVESGLLMKEIAGAVSEIADLGRKIEDSVRIGMEESERAAHLENTIRDGEQKLLVLEGEVEAVRKRLQETISTVERAQGEIRLGEERLRNLDELEKNLGADDGKQRIEQARAERDALIAEVEAERDALAKISEEASGAGQLAKELTEQLEVVERRLNEGRAIQSLRMKRDAESAHRSERTREIKRELKGIVTSAPEMEEAVQVAKAEFDAVDAKIKEARERIKVLEADQIKLRQDEDRDAQQNRNALAERSSLEGRIRGIESTIDAHEGLNQGARAVMEAHSQGILRANYVPVGEAVEVAQEYAVALDIALGGASNDLIVDSETDAKTAIAFLKENRLGRATFQPIPLMRPFEPSLELRRLYSEKGVIGRASDLVKCKPAHRVVIDSLLGRVLVVDHIDTALRLAKTTGWSRMVTVEGEVVHSSGAVTGGAASRQSFGLVQRKAELVKLTEDLDRLADRLAEADARSRNRAKSRAAIEMSIGDQRKVIETLGGEAQDARSYYQSLNDEWTGMDRAKTRLETELQKLDAGPDDDLEEVDVAAIEAERDGILKKLAAGSADADQAETRLREADQRVQQAAVRLAGGERRLATMSDDEENRERRLAHLGPERERLRSEIGHHQARLVHATDEKATLEEKTSNLLGQRDELHVTRQSLSQQVREARDNAAAVGDAAHQAEIGRARADAKRAAASSRLMEEYGLSEEEAIEQADSILVPNDAAQVTARLRRELKAMGDVNLGAIEAFERLTQRYDELQAQKDDVEQGIEQIHAGISELDKLTRERFMATFSRLEVEFADLVTRLFGGGEGKLSLTDSTSVLETGLDIEVQLPGKKKQRLELLSGGERALCASAFLFSLLRVKPSPLVVLDEVDAPLDGRNVERFSEILVEFSKQMQFIVITHNPTTIQAAPIWLGVTMREPGVSTLAPVRLPENTPTKLPKTTDETHAVADTTGLVAEPGA